MKKLFIFLLILAMVPIIALADLPDISGLTYDELVELKNQINLAMWSSSEWQEVEVPIGLWEIGKDIPAGTWRITPIENTNSMHLWYGDVLNESGTDAGYGWDYVNGYNGVLSTKKNKDGSWKYPDDPHFVERPLKEGWYVKNNGPVIFTPPQGKPDLGFK